MTADTSRTLMIESSPAELLALTGICALATALATTVALLPGPFSFAKIVGGYLTSLLLSLLTGVGLWRLVTSGRPVITISPDGFRDTRLIAALIPWSDVTGISTWQSRGQKFMVLALRPGVEDRLELTSMGLLWRWTRGANRYLGADGLCISAYGVKIDYDTLLQTSLDYLHRYQGDLRGTKPAGASSS
jgi:hypothetical protein